MTEIRPQETQQELFPAFSKEPKSVERFPSIATAQKPILISTNVEQLILVGIVAILVGCFVFFLGVLRGRSLDSEAARSPVASPLPIRQAGISVRAPQPNPARTVAKGAAASAQAAKPAVTPQLARVNPSKPYTIQLATFKRREMAEKEIAALRRNGFLATLKASGDYYEVCVGQYASIEEAKKDLKLFASRYKDRFLRRR